MKEFQLNFSTIIGIDTCAGGNFLKWEQVLDCEVGDVYTYLNYRSAKAQAEIADFEFKQRQKK